MRDTQRKGDIATTCALARFTRLGYDVSLPITESAAYDLIVDIMGKIKRVQVKYTSGIEVDLRQIHTNSKGYVVKKVENNAYDWLYIYKESGEEYLYKKCFSSRRSLRPDKDHLLQ